MHLKEIFQKIFYINFVTEFGDKSQIGTIALSSTFEAFKIYVGGMLVRQNFNINYFIKNSGANSMYLYRNFWW